MHNCGIDSSVDYGSPGEEPGEPEELCFSMGNPHAVYMYVRLEMIDLVNVRA